MKKGSENKVRISKAINNNKKLLADEQIDKFIC